MAERAVRWTDLPATAQVEHRRTTLPVEGIEKVPGHVRGQLEPGGYSTGQYAKIETATARVRPELLRVEWIGRPGSVVDLGGHSRFAAQVTVWLHASWMEAWARGAA